MTFDNEFLQKLEQLQFIARRLRHSKRRGEHRSIKKGSSLEFRDYRRYNPGDDLRYIDWNLFLRQRALFIKLFNAEQELPIHLLIDVSASMNYHDKLEYSVKLAAALGFIAQARQDQVGISVLGESVRDSLAPMRRNREALFRYLQSIQAEGGTSLNVALREYVRLGRRPGTAVVISDLFDPGGYQEGLFRLRDAGYEIILLQVLHEQEVNPKPSGFMRLIDSETKENMDITVSRRLAIDYREALEDYFMEIEAFSMDHSIDYFRTTTMVPFEDVVLQYLREGQYLR